MILLRNFKLFSAGPNKLHQLAVEVGKIVNKKLGDAEYTRRLQDIQTTQNVKRRTRKEKSKAIAVTQPQLAAQLKIKKSAKRLASRKRRNEIDGGVTKKPKLN